MNLSRIARSFKGGHLRSDRRTKKGQSRTAAQKRASAKRRKR